MSSKKSRVNSDQLSPDGGYIIKTYYPSWEELKDFSAFMKKIHDDNGHRAGLAKIIPPAGYTPRKAGYGDDKLYEMDITNPIKQKNNGERGLYQQFNVVEKKKMSVRAFKKLAEDKYPTPLHRTHEELERIFWKNIFTQPSIYGADVSGSLYDDDVEEFNLTRLKTILDNINEDYGVTIQGVNTAYLYFGMWKTSFSWHTEDMDLYSINYLHEGAPKSWYCISPEHGKRFERLAASFFPHSFRTCKAFLRHKTTLISPQVLRKYSIPFSKCTQQKGEFMITFPFSYHSGYNHGFNIAEATNFALEYWIDFGKWATRCECSSESVKISMQTFVKRYQPDRYELWLQGKDICHDPRDIKHYGPAPKPTEHDLYLMGTHIRPEEEDQNEDENFKNNTLQQNQSSNFKIKTKAARKAYPSLADTYQKYSDFLMQNDNQNRYDISMQLSHYSPIPNEMQQIDHLSLDTIQNTDDCFNFVARNTQPYIGHNAQEHNKKMNNSKPDYKKELDAKLELKKRKKEERAKKRKEKRMKVQMIPPKELLQFLPVTFTHEKRFNRCLAALAPHCSICQILVPFPKDDEALWGTSVPCSTPPTDCCKSPQETTMIANQDLPNNTSSNELSVLPLDSISPTLSQTNTTINNKTPSIAGPKVEEFVLPESSAVLLPRGVFNRYFRKSQLPVDVTNDTTNATTTSDEVNQDNLSESVEDSGYIPEDKLDFIDMNLESSELLQCSVCMLCVHKLCYGLDKLPADKADWICDRCKLRNRSLINCELCPCRGGAMKEYKNTWIHITCALTLPDINYIDLVRPEKSQPKKIKSSENLSDKNTCTYCNINASLPKYVQGKCMPCSGGYYQTAESFIPCTNMFHPTCAYRNGAEFDYNDRDPGSKFFALCSTCRTQYKNLIEDNKEQEPELEVIKAGTQIIARASNNYYYNGIVDSHEVVTYYSIYFPQHSEVMTGVTSKRIVDFDPNKKLRVGDRVVVKDKDERREGKYKAQETHEEYHILFVMEAGQLDKAPREKVKRKNIYLNIDQMPEELLHRYKGVIDNSSSLPGNDKSDDEGGGIVDSEVDNGNSNLQESEVDIENQTYNENVAQIKVEIQ